MVKVEKDYGRNTQSESSVRKMVYTILKMVLSAIVFSITFFVWLSDKPQGVEKFLYIFLLYFASGAVGGTIARLFSRYWSYDWGTVPWTANLIGGTLYSILIYFKFTDSVSDFYEIDLSSLDKIWIALGSRAFWEYVLVMLGISFFVFMLSELISIKVNQKVQGRKKK
jgi:hypothetical protein